jgi:hypothetical protein
MSYLYKPSKQVKIRRWLNSTNKTCTDAMTISNNDLRAMGKRRKADTESKHVKQESTAYWGKGHQRWQAAVAAAAAAAAAAPFPPLALAQPA